MFLFKGGYANGPLAYGIVKNSIINLCSSLKNEAVTLSDALAPPDFILNSVIASSNGKVNLFNYECHHFEKVQNIFIFIINNFNINLIYSTLKLRELNTNIFFH